jgi:hypothetical protein
MVFEELPIVATETTVRWGARFRRPARSRRSTGVLHVSQHDLDGWQGPDGPEAGNAPEVVKRMPREILARTVQKTAAKKKAARKSAKKPKKAKKAKKAKKPKKKKKRKKKKKAKKKKKRPSCQNCFAREVSCSCR